MNTFYRYTDGQISKTKFFQDYIKKSQNYQIMFFGKLGSGSETRLAKKKTPPPGAFPEV